MVTLDQLKIHIDKARTEYAGITKNTENHESFTTAELLKALKKGLATLKATNYNDNPFAKKKIKDTQDIIVNAMLSYPADPDPTKLKEDLDALNAFLKNEGKKNDQDETTADANGPFAETDQVSCLEKINTLFPKKKNSEINSIRHFFIKYKFIFVVRSHFC